MVNENKNFNLIKNLFEFYNKKSLLKKREREREKNFLLFNEI